MKRHLYSTLFVVPFLFAACSNPAENKPVAEVSEAKPEAAPAAPAADPAAAPAAPQAAAEQLAINPASSKVEFTGSKVTGKHDGGFKQFTGTIDLVDGKPEASKVSIDIDTASLWSDNDRLTGHLQSPDFFDVAAHPTASFSSTKIEPRADAPNGYTVTGNLNLHGVTKSITFPATIAVAPDAVKVNAEFVVMRKDFNIVYPGKPNDLIRDEVVVRLDVNAPRGGAAPAGAAPAVAPVDPAAAPGAAPAAPAVPADKH